MTNTPEPHELEFAEVNPALGVAPDNLAIEDLAAVRLSLTASLGKASMLVREILDLKPGAVVQLDKLAGEMTDIYVNGLALARGEVVVIGDSLHIRIGEIIGAGEKVEEDSIEDA